MVLNRIVFRLHSLAGICAGLFILLTSLSGSILVFQEELEDLGNPKITMKSGYPSIGLDSLYRVIRYKFPKAAIYSASLRTDGSRAFPWVMYDSSYREGKEPLRVYLDPQSARMIKSEGAGGDWKHNPLAWIAGFHSSFQAGKAGEVLLGVISMVLLVSSCTGLYLYRRELFSTLRFRKPPWSAGHLHPALGAYSLLFILVTAVSGGWMQRYVFDWAFLRSPAYKQRSFQPSGDLPYGAGKAISQLESRYPGFKAWVIYFPSSPGGRTAVYGSRSTNSFIHSKKYADAIFLDSAGRISGTRFVDEIPRSDLYDIINAQIHYGRYGGLFVKMLYSFFGLSVSWLSLTGVILFFKRIRKPT